MAELSHRDLRVILSRLEAMERGKPWKGEAPHGGRLEEPSGPSRPRRAPDDDTKPRNVVGVHIYHRPVDSSAPWGGPLDGGPWHPDDEESLRVAMERHRMTVYPDEHEYLILPANESPAEPPHDDRPSRGPSGHYVVDHYRPRKALIARDTLGHISIHSPEREAALHRKYPGKYQTRVGYFTKTMSPFSSGFSQWANDLFE
jgi:hypothetical protein